MSSGCPKKYFSKQSFLPDWTKDLKLLFFNPEDATNHWSRDLVPFHPLYLYYMENKVEEGDRPTFFFFSFLLSHLDCVILEFK